MNAFLFFSFVIRCVPISKCDHYRMELDITVFGCAATEHVHGEREGTRTRIHTLQIHVTNFKSVENLPLKVLNRISSFYCCCCSSSFTCTVQQEKENNNLIVPSRSARLSLSPFMIVLERITRIEPEPEGKKLKALTVPRFLLQTHLPTSQRPATKPSC